MIERAVGNISDQGHFLKSFISSQDYDMIFLGGCFFFLECPDLSASIHSQTVSGALPNAVIISNIKRKLLIYANVQVKRTPQKRWR